MRNSLRILALLLLGPFAHAHNLPTAQPALPGKSGQSIQQFLKTVIRYATKKSEFLKGWELLDGSDRIYSPSLMSAIQPPDVIDNDHLMWSRACGCRYDGKDHNTFCGDSSGLKLSDASIRMTSGETADVAFRSRKDKLTWHLIKIAQGWRIDDVSTADFPSLKAYLLKEAGSK